MNKKTKIIKNIKNNDILGEEWGEGGKQRVPLLCKGSCEEGQGQQVAQTQKK
jgi:hypothetical protein